MPETETVFLELIAGRHPNGQPVIERLPAVPSDTANQFWLLQSPLFVGGCARGDCIELLRNNPGKFRMRVRSGQLCVRVFSRDPIEIIADELTPAVERLGGRLDISSPRALAYSIHVAVGFSEIEQVFATWVPADTATWSYGNVYGEDGETLAWWDDLLAP
ncbi:MAG: DUF4265 domain-containing protein [Spongiibacteraceae bacterium]